MSPPDASVRVMREVPPYRPDLDPNLESPMVWLYENGDWQQVDDPDPMARRRRRRQRACCDRLLRPLRQGS
jgi:hypothetical protein